MPGEIEERNRRHNLANGIEIDDTVALRIVDVIAEHEGAG